jgi:hypothetical protein
VNQESGDSEIVQHRLLSGTGNPLVQNIFSTVDTVFSEKNILPYISKLEIALSPDGRIGCRI